LKQYISFIIQNQYFLLKNIFSLLNNNVLNYNEV